MPDRIVRAGILTSDAVNELSWAEECFYRRLMSVADDYGRYDARPSILRASLYPLKLDRVSERDIATWLGACQKVGLVTVYTVDGKDFIEITKFDQRLRAKNSKYPHPPSSDSTCQQMSSNATEVNTEEKLYTLTSFAEFWLAYPRKKSKGQAEKSWKKLDPDECLRLEIMQGLERAKRSEQWKNDGGKYIPYPATWLNARGWEDEDLLPAKPKFGGI